MAKKSAKTRKATNSSNVSNTSKAQKLLLALLLPLLAALILEWRVELFTSIFSSEEVLHDPRILRDRTIFKVATLPGKGRSMVAVRDIKPGELIIEEEPMVLMPPEISSDYLPNLLKSFNNASRDAFLGLSYAHLPSYVSTDPKTRTESDLREIATAIIHTNGIAISDDLLGVFPRIAIMNHACAGAFNAAYSWKPNAEGSGEMLVHALKPVKRGEEITIFYMDTRLPRAKRREHLKEHYNFTCQCKVCSLPDELSEESDRRLARIVSLYTNFTQWASGEISGREAGDLAREIWKLEDEQEYFHERGKLADEAAIVAAAHSDEKAVREWAKLSLQWYSIELGKDSPRVKRMSRIVQNPKSHPEWGKSPKEMVGALSV